MVWIVAWDQKEMLGRSGVRRGPVGTTPLIPLFRLRLLAPLPDRTIRLPGSHNGEEEVVKKNDRKGEEKTGGRGEEGKKCSGRAGGWGRRGEEFVVVRCRRLLLWSAVQKLKDLNDV